MNEGRNGAHKIITYQDTHQLKNLTSILKIKKKKKSSLYKMSLNFALCIQNNLKLLKKFFKNSKIPLLSALVGNRTLKL